MRLYGITRSDTIGTWIDGVIMLEAGKIIGFDADGEPYYGDYAYNPKTEMIEATITMVMPPEVRLARDRRPQQKEWRITFQASFPSETPVTSVFTQTF